MSEISGLQNSITLKQDRMNEQKANRQFADRIRTTDRNIIKDLNPNVFMTENNRVSLRLFGRGIEVPKRRELKDIQTQDRTIQYSPFRADSHNPKKYMIIPNAPKNPPIEINTGPNSAPIIYNPHCEQRKLDPFMPAVPWVPREQILSEQVAVKANFYPDTPNRLHPEIQRIPTNLTMCPPFHGGTEEASWRQQNLDYLLDTAQINNKLLNKAMIEIAPAQPVNMKVRVKKSMKMDNRQIMSNMDITKFFKSAGLPMV
jgi:hypothetical protein